LLDKIKVGRNFMSKKRGKTNNESVCSLTHKGSERRVTMVFTWEGQQFSIQHNVDTERCSGCKHCVKYCDEGVWVFDKEKGYAWPKYIKDCVGCLKCELACLNNCIEIVPLEMIKNDPLENY